MELGTRQDPQRLGALTSLLAREREGLEVLAYRLEHQALLLERDDGRWLGYVADEVEAALDDLCAIELLRAVAVGAVANRLGLGSSPSLEQLADRCPPSWAGVLREHADGLRVLAADVRDVLDANQRRATARFDHAVTRRLHLVAPVGAR